MKIAIVGSGYVGLVTGACLANTGNHVVGVDVDARKIQRLNEGHSPIYEPGLDELLHRNLQAGRITFTTERVKSYAEAEIIFICVGTPSDERGHARLDYVLSAAADIGDAINISRDRRPKIIVVKSTVPVGTNTKVRNAISARTNLPFRMASNPEFLKEGAAIADFTHPDRVVVGCDDPDTGDRMRELYAPFVRQGNPIFVMDIASAEMVKYAANAMLATKISFINEIANLCERYGADIDEVRKGMCADRRIGNQFLYPGLGYGGSCFPKDVLACISMGDECASPTDILRAVHAVNQRQRELFIAKVDQHFGGRDAVAGKTFAFWGIAFKPGTDDVREAPSISLMNHLLERNARVRAYDPVAAETCRQIMGDRIEYCEDSMKALEGADGLMVCTDWDEFKLPDFDRMRAIMRTPAIFDGRNIYKPTTVSSYGFHYYSVGRLPAAARAWMAA